MRIAASLLNMAISTIIISSLSELVPHRSVWPEFVFGVILGSWGGVAAAIFPIGERSWGARQALRVFILGVIAGGIVGVVLFDFSSIGPGKRGGIIFASGFAAEMLLQIGKSEGRAAIANWLRNTASKFGAGEKR